MKLKSGKRVVALVLAAVLTICGIEFPAVNVHADTGVLDGTISDDGTTLMYGDRDSLEGEDFAPFEILETDNNKFFSDGVSSFEMTMVFRFNEAPAASASLYTLFTLEDTTKTTTNGSNFASVIFQPFHSATQGRVHVIGGSGGILSFSGGASLIADTKYHKLSISIIDNTFVVAIDGNQYLNWTDTRAGAVSDVFKDNERGETRLLIGKKATNGTYGGTSVNDFPGTIKYVEFSTQQYTTNTSPTLLAHNQEVSNVLANAFDTYVAGHESKQETDYTADTWSSFSTALQAAQTIKGTKTEQGIYSTYKDLKTAVEGLEEFGGTNTPPTAKTLSRTLVKGRTLTVTADELAEDPDGDRMTLTVPEDTANEKLNLTVGADGCLQISCKEGITVGTEPEQVTVVVADTRGGRTNVTFSVKIQESFKLEYDLRERDFNPKSDPSSAENIYKAGIEDVKILSQIQDSMEVSMTFRFDESKAYNAGNTNYYYLMELGDSRYNYSAADTNVGKPSVAASTISFIVDVSQGKIFCNTGAYFGSSDWQPTTNKNLKDGKAHTLTLSISAGGMNLYLDDSELKNANSNSTQNNTLNFVKAFLGDATLGSFYKNWSTDADTLTIGDCYEYSAGRHPNYGRFGGEIKSVVISDGTYSQDNLAEHHKSYGTEIAKDDLQDAVDAVEDNLNEATLTLFKETDAYKKAEGILDGTTETYAADIYNTITEVQDALYNVENIGLTDIGGNISAMFNNDGDNSWIFGGGVETQGRFSEIGGVRNYIGHFEEFIRWSLATSSEMARQRYTINVGKTGVDAAAFASKLDGYIEKLDPKAVSYLIGSEDYEKGDAGITTFQTALTSIMTKSLAMKEGNGFVVIQLPHVVQDTAKQELAEKYTLAAKDAMRTYISAHSDQKDRIVMVDHMALTNTDTFKANCLTEDGLLNAEGHFEIANEFKQKTYGTSGSLQAITWWTEEDAPGSYENTRPSVTAEAGGNLKVVIPEDVAAGKTSWKYTIEIEEMEICGSAQETTGRTFTINELPEGEDYTLTLESSDNAVQLAKVYGTLEAGNKGGAEQITALQQKIKEKVDDTDKPLTWLFMGDSITHAALWMNGYDGIAQIFEKYLKEDIGRTDDIVINTAVSGATTASTLAQIDQRLGKYTPDIVSVMLGTNDAGTSGIRSYTYIENLETIVTKIRECNKDALIIFRTPTPADKSVNASRIKVLEDWVLDSMRRVAEQDGNILFIDQYTDWNQEMNTFSYLLGNQYYLGNNLHPGPVGQLRMAQQFIRECGLNTDTRIANLSYQFNYTDNTQNSTPDITEGRSRIALEKEEIAKLQTESGKTFGSMEVTLTDTTNNRTYTKRDYTSGDRFILRYLPNSGGRTYRVSVTGNVADSAEKVKFSDTQVTLSPENPVLPYYAFLDRTYIRDISEGALAANFYTGIAAPEGEHHFELVQDDGGNAYNNALFEIDGDMLKIKQALKKYNTYTVCIQSAQNNDDDDRSLKAVYTLKTMPTLEAIREDAALAMNSPSDRSALDLDLAGVSFDENDYVDLGDADSTWYDNGKYLAVLNNLRQNTTGGTIIYRFRTDQSNTLIFGSGSNETITNTDNTIMAFGLSGGEIRGIFRAPSSGLRGNFNSEFGRLNDGNWHTVAVSFDTTKPDYQNQVLISLDGSKNIFDTSWWTANFRSWFNQNQNQEITHFAIGGGIVSTTTSLGAQMPKFTGDISFVTVNDQVYTEEELQLLTRTDWIEGEQALQINGTAVTLPEGALYTASTVAWDEDNAEAEFTLTANEGALFDKDISVSIVNGVALDIVDQIQVQHAPDDRSVNVRFSISEWRSDSVFESAEITVKDGISTDVGSVVSEEIIEKLNDMRRGSVTIRYKLDETAMNAEGRLALFSISNGKLNGYSAFYVTPSTGAIGYSIRNQETNASTTINSDEAAREDIKNQYWHTVTYIFSATGTEIYLDGNRILANAEIGFFSNTTGVSHAQFGSVYRSADQTNEFAFSGEINYMQVTYDILDADEIEKLHAATTATALELPEDAVKTEDTNLYYANYDESPYYRMPSLLTTSGGTVIAAIDRRKTTEADYGDIDTVIRRSTDGGKTWSDPQTIFNQPDGGTLYSFTTAPTMVEDENGRIHMFVNLFPESQGRLSTGLIEKGSGFKEVDGKLYPILRNYVDTAFNAEDAWTQEYTIREGGVVYEETEDGSVRTNYHVPNYLSAEGGGALYDGTEYVGNIYVYTGADAGALKVPRVMSVVTCYSDDDGATWEGYQNITGMIKEDWMKFMRVGPGAGIRLEHQKNADLNGRIVVPICYTNGDGIYSYAASLIYSDDNGVTWNRTDTPVAQVDKIDVTAGSFRDNSLRESQIVEMNDGTIKMFSINYSGRLKMSTGTFEADGITWTDIQQTTIQDLASPISVIRAPGNVDGKETILLSAPLGPGSNNGYIHMGLYQDDGTFEWKYLRKIKADGFGNSCMSVMGDGESIGILFKGTGEDITFTSMNEKWFTSPRYADFETPVIEDIEMEWAGTELIFTVSFDSAVMKKGTPTLKLKLDGTTDAEATYVSGNSSKQYVFRYDLGEQEVLSVKAVCIAMQDDTGFVEGVTGQMPVMPEDASFEFVLSRESVIEEMNKLLEELKELYNSDGSGYDSELWEEFKAAYKAVQTAVSGDGSARELSLLLQALKDAKANLDNQEPEDPDVQAAKRALSDTLASYKDIFDQKKAEYTEASWNKFAEAYEAAQKALAEGCEDKEKLLGLKEALETAFAGLDLIRNTTGDPTQNPATSKLASPSITSLKAIAQKKVMGVKIQVQKVANADIYTVYRKVGNSVTQIGRTSASGVVYDQTPVSAKTASYYAVAESSSGQYQKSDNGAAKTIKLLASVKKITAKQVGKKTQVRLSWKKVKNAQKYIVYRSTKKDSGYVRLKTLKKSVKSYVDKKVKKGKTYYYRIVVKTKKGYSGVTTSKKIKIKK